MLSTSTAFQNEIATQTKARDVHGKVIFRLVDTTAKGDCTATSTDTESITETSYMVDDIESFQSNYATFETDRWLLDGSFALMPDSSYDNNGWWSDDLSDSSTREFTPNITNTYTFTSDHSSSGITILWDTFNDEYAEEFDVKFYDSGDSLIETISETTNTDSYYVSETSVANYRKIEIVIKKWSVADRRARITEVIFGVVKTYSKELENIIQFKVNENVDVISESIKGNNLDFEIDNQDKEFDILNPSGIFAFLQKNQRIDTFLGVTTTNGIEYVRSGRFFLESWGTNQNKLTAKFKGVDLLEKMHKEKYYKGNYSSTNLKTLAESVMADYGLSSSDYNVDSALSSISVINPLPICTYKETLQYIAIAGMCVLYVDRDGVIQIEQVGATSTGKTLDLNNSFESTPQINLANVLKQVDVNVYTATQATSSSTVAKSTVDITGTKDVIVVYESPANDVSASVSSGSINTETYYANACYLNITATGSTTITVTGDVLTFTESLDTTTTGENDGETKTINNRLISDTTVASDVGTWIKTELEKRNIFKTNWRMNPALEITDIVDVENHFSTYNDARIFSQTFNFTGALRGYSEVRG